MSKNSRIVLSDWSDLQKSFYKILWNIDSCCYRKMSTIFTENMFLPISDVLLPPSNLAIIYLFKANNRNRRKRCEICSKLTMKRPEQNNWRRSGVFIVNFMHISHLFLVFLLLLWTSNENAIEISTRWWGKW